MIWSSVFTQKIIVSFWRSFSCLWDWSPRFLPGPVVVWLFPETFLSLCCLSDWNPFSSDWGVLIFSFCFHQCLSWLSCFWWTYYCCFSYPQTQNFCSFLRPYLNRQTHNCPLNLPFLNRRLRFRFKFNRPESNHHPNCSKDSGCFIRSLVFGTEWFVSCLRSFVLGFVSLFQVRYFVTPKRGSLW